MRVLIAASGSGGHLMPALYLAEEFRARGDQVLFVGSGRPLEARLIDAAGFSRNAISFIGLKRRSFGALIKLLISFPRAFVQTALIVRRFKPDVVVGMGGYVSVPPVLIARIFGIPSWIHEAELQPGRATRLLKYFATKISLAFPTNPLAVRPDSLVTGHPVRSTIVTVPAWDRGRTTINRFLIVGGSQGAEALDRSLPAILSELNLPQIEVWHQCREQNVESVRNLYAENKITARVESFIVDICEAYAFADIIISRAGAGAIMELGSINRATILVPFPHAQGGHQLQNAKLLADAGKALIVEEGQSFAVRLEEAIKRLLDPQAVRQLIERTAPIRPLEATKRIVDGCHALAAQSW